jgi:AcrR family transcriptional regulator
MFAREYDNVCLNDPVADAGVSKGAFYHWFPSRRWSRHSRDIIDAALR